MIARLIPLIGQHVDEETYEELRELVARGSDCVQGGCTYFHQECEGRPARLANMNFIGCQAWSKELLKMVHRVQDPRHRVCSFCLEAVQGSREHMYTNITGKASA